MLAPRKRTLRGTHTSQFSRGFVFLALLTAALFVTGCGAIRTRKGGDFYTSDLINARIAVGPVAEARESSRDSLFNRRIALTTEDLQREFAEGLSEIHRAASVQRIGGKGGPEKGLSAARRGGAEILIMPRVEQLTIDNMGRNGVEPVAVFTDVLLFPISLATAALTRGNKAGLAYEYMPIYNVMVTMKMTLDYYRVSDGTLLLRRPYLKFIHCKTNKDNIEGAKLDPTDDLRAVGREYGRFAVRELGRGVAKEEITELSNKVSRSNS